MKKSTLIVGVLIAIIIAGCNNGSDKKAETNEQDKKVGVKQPVPNPFLSSPVYGQTHFNPAQTDAIPYKVKSGTFNIDLTNSAHVEGGPVNITTLDATNKDYMWAIGTDRVTYVLVKDGKFEPIAKMMYPGIAPRETKEYYDKTYANVEEVTQTTERLYGKNAGTVLLKNGLYTLVDSDNTLYSNVGTKICAFGLIDPSNPAKGLALKRQIEMADFMPKGAIPGTDFKALTLLGMGMTYDGYIVVGALNGIAVIDRDFKTTKQFYAYSATEFCTNSFCIDDKNGIYVATGSFIPNSDGYMRKLIWNGKTLSDSETDGAWKAAYDCGDWPPAIKITTGTGSTPTLMGFGDDEDKLVVIPDGTNRANIVAFWRDEIPKDFQQKPGIKTRRIADAIPVNCGLANDLKWIQTEQSLVVSGNGVFFVNNMPNFKEGETFPSDRLVEAMASGPVLEPPFGMEKFEWNSETNSFKSAWTRSDINSTTMVPIVSEGSEIVFVSGYSENEGWIINGMNWKNGEVVHKTIFGKTNYGNGAYALLQFFENGDLLFNSISGPYRVKYKN